MEIFLTEVQAEALRDMIGTVDALPIRLAIGDGHSGHGLYASLSEYPEEGADLIAALSSQPPAPREAASERDAFEAWYVTDMQSAGFVNSTAEEVRALRDGDHYGAHRASLNGKWEGWQARASLTGTASTGGKE